MFLGLLLDLCIRNLDSSNKVVALSCISYSMSNYLETSRINDADIDAYVFLINEKGNVKQRNCCVNFLYKKKW